MFNPGEEGVAAFSEYASRAPDSLFYLLADVVEEEFFQENIPYLRGSDRRALLGRKLAQRYRDTSLALALPLGTEMAGRREERILYTSFTNTQQFQPWLGALRAIEARIAGVYSIPLLTPLVCKRIGFKSRRYMMVSLQQAGLRQSYVENARIRFSRLGRVELQDPRALAEACAAESARFHQYLVNSRILSREEELEVVVLAPSEHRPLYEAACTNTTHLQFHVLDLDAVARRAGLKSAPAETLAEGLFLHVLARARFVAQFADDSLRRFYDLWRAQVGLVTAGTAVFLICLLLSAVKLLQTDQINRVAEADRLQEAAASQQYARTQATFPKTPIPAAVLKTTVKNYQALLRQDAPLLELLFEVSHALAAVPQIDVEKIDWEIAPLKRAGAREGSKSPAAAPGENAPQDLRVQLAEISGRLLVPQASDYRNISMVVNQFVEALRSRPGVEVVATKLPFDINAEKSISGDIGTARSAEVPRFSVLVSKRLGT
jgi:hypothetical protein